MSRTIKSTKDLNALFSAKLKSSDLTLADAKKLKYEIIEDPTKLESHFYKTPAFRIPYHDQLGNSTGFYRIRYLTNTNRGMLAATSAKARRYDQPALELPQLYLPKLLPGKHTWRDVFHNPELPLCITEGELKAACSTRHGIPTIALGGVWNFKSKKNGLFRLPIFNDINLKGRKVYIIFDSDAATNPQVLFAQYKFSEEIFNMGAEPLVVNIPREGDKKHGIDDYIVEYGIDEFKKLITDERNISEFAFTRELLRLNGEIALVTKPVALVHYDSGQLLNRQDAAMMYATARMMKKSIKPAKKEGEDDEIKYTEASAFDEWIKWEQRAEVWSMSYEPGQPKFVEMGERRHFNTWNGWGTIPQKGDVGLWKWLLDNIFKNATPAERRWFEQWCAYPLQNPGVKMFSCPILFGHAKGTGKSLLGVTLLTIYGENGAEITNTELEDTRNVFAAEKQFILGNEVTGSDKRGVGDRLKNLITQHSVTINKKYQPDYVVRDTINYYFTSNHVDAIYMDDEERRFFVHEVLGPRLVDVDPKKVQAYDAAIKDGSLPKALFHHLMNVDLKGFDPYGPAPHTASKDTMVEASRSEIEAWAFKLKEDPDTCLRVGNTILKFALYRIKDLVDIYAPDSFKKPYEKTLANALRKAGFHKAAGGQSCPTKDGYLNLWIIRDSGKIVKLQRKDIGALYDDEREFKIKEKKFAQKEKK